MNFEVINKINLALLSHEIETGVRPAGFDFIPDGSMEKDEREKVLSLFEE